MVGLQFSIARLQFGRSYRYTVLRKEEKKKVVSSALVVGMVNLQRKCVWQRGRESYRRCARTLRSVLERERLKLEDGASVMQETELEWH